MRIDDEIRTRTEAFVADLVAVLSRAAVEGIADALASSLDAPRAAPRHAGRTAPAAARRAARRPGQKRAPEELASLIEQVAAHVSAHPGQRMEQIREALGVTTQELTLPIRKLLLAKRVKATGHKRATAYFPA